MKTGCLLVFFYIHIYVDYIYFHENNMQYLLEQITLIFKTFFHPRGKEVNTEKASLSVKAVFKSFNNL